MSNVGSKIKKLGLMKAYDFLDKDPEANLPKLVDWFDRYVSPDVPSTQRDLFREIVEKKDSNWYQLLVSLWSDFDDDVRKALFENLIINANALAAPQAKESREKFGCNIPWAISLDISNRESEGNMSFDDWDSVIEQAKDLGTFMFAFEGGEPMETPEEIIALCNKHSECQFMIFTDGRNIDDDFADQMLRVKNLIVTIKVTKDIPGEELVKSLKILREKKLPFGAYCIYNKDNQDIFTNEAFFDRLIEYGAKFCLFFSSLSAEEDKIYPKMQEYRKSKQLLTINFCKDQDITGGCVAGGKYYCSINSKGEIEPCFFVNQSDSNVRKNTLLEAYRAPLFMKYHDTQVPCNAEK